MDLFVPLSFTAVPTGVASFSAANKKILETNLENILANAFEETFEYPWYSMAGVTKPEKGYLLQKGMAKMFGKSAAGKLAKVIDDYVKTAIKSQMIQIVPKTLVSPAGPVTGMMSTLTADIKIN